MKQQMMMKISRYIIFVLLLSLCITSNDFAMAEKQEIKAGGSILASAMWRNWVLSYRVFRGSKLKSLTYDAVGSGDGLKGIKNGTYDMIATELPLTPVDIEQSPDLMIFPVVANSISIGFSLEGVKNLNLSREAVVGIFSGTISRWDDPMIVKDNQEIAHLLPPVNITVVVRSDVSGTTNTLTNFFNSINSSFPIFNNDKWSHNPRFIRSPDSLSIAIQVSKTPYCIGYVGTSESNRLQITQASIMNKVGQFIPPKPSNIIAAMNSANNISIIDVEGQNAYPISVYSYVVVHSRILPCEKTAEIFKLLLWIATSKEADEVVHDSGFVTLSTEKKNEVFLVLKEDIGCEGDPKIYHIVFSPINYSSAPGAIVITLATLMITVCAVLALFIILTKDFPIIKAFSPLFAILILLGCVCGFISLILWSLDITNTVCIARLWFTSIGYPLILSNLLAKNYRLYKIFNLKLKELLAENISNNQIYAFSVLGLSIHVIILICWTVIDPPSASTEYLNGGNYNFCRSNDRNIEAIFTALLTTYNALLLILSCILAFLVRKLPMAYNESRHLAYVCYNFLFCSVLVPLFLSETVEGTPERTNAVLYTILFASFTFPVCVLFFPKCWRVYKFGGNLESFSWRKSDSKESKDKRVSHGQAQVPSNPLSLHGNAPVRIHPAQHHAAGTSSNGKSGHDNTTSNNIELSINA